MGSLGRIKFLEPEDWFDKGYGIVGGTNDTNMEFGFQIMPWRVGPACVESGADHSRRCSGRMSEGRTQTDGRPRLCSPLCLWLRVLQIV